MHYGGTYVNMDGPAFSTGRRARCTGKLGFDVIGMTNLPEAKLAREAEIALATPGDGDRLRLLAEDEET